MNNAISTTSIKGTVITKHSKQIARDRKTDKAISTLKSFCDTVAIYAENTDKQIQKLKDDIKKRDRIIKQQMRLITKLHKMLKDKEKK